MIKKIIDKIKNRKSDGVLKHSASFLIFVGFNLFVNIFFRKYISGVLTIDDFGVYTAILALLSMLVIPLGVVPVYISKTMAGYIEKKDIPRAFVFQKKMAKGMMFILFGLAAVLMVFSPFFRDNYHLNSIFPVFLAVVMCVLFIITSTYTSSLQSLQSFVRIGSINLTSNVVKIISVILLFGLILPATNLLYYVSAYNFVILAVIVSQLSLLGMGYFLFKQQGRSLEKPLPSVKLNIKSIVKELWPMAVLLFMFGILKNIDEYFARQFLDKMNNGIYASIITVGKSSIFLVAAIIYVIFPKLSSTLEDRVASRRIMFKGLFLSLVAFSSIMFFVVLFPEQIIQILTHKKYLTGAVHLKWFFIAFMPYSLIYVFVNFFTIHKNLRFLFGLIILTVGEIVFFQIFHASISQIINVLGGFGYAILIYCVLFWYIYYVREPKDKLPVSLKNENS